MIDTGTDTTSIVDAALAPLGIVPIGKIFANTAGGLALVNRYAISLVIPDPSGVARNNLVLPNLEVLGMAHVPIGFDVLIGLDVLSECLVLIDGRAGRFTLAF